MMAKLGDCVSIYGRYETMLGQAEPFQAVLSDVYLEILVFLRKAKIAFTTSGIVAIPQNSDLDLLYF